MLTKKEMLLLDNIYSTTPQLMDYEFEERVQILHNKTNIDKVNIEEYLIFTTMNTPEIQYKYEYETG